MNILFITHYTSLMGANRSMLAAIDYLTMKGCSCHVLCPEEGDIIEELKIRNLGYLIHRHFPCQDTVRHNETMWQFYKRNFRMQYYSIRTLEPIGNYIATHKIQLIYSNSSVISIGLYTAIKYNLKHIFHLREFGDIDYGLVSIFPLSLLKRFFLLSDKIVCISKAIQNHFFGLKNYKKVVQVYNGIYTIQQLKEIENQSPIAPNKKIVNLVIVGVVRKEKGQHLLVQAFNSLSRKYPELRLHLVGPETDAYCKRFIDGKDVEQKITFHGYVKNTDFIYKIADLAYICSTNEGFGRVIVEAMAWGVPIIGYNNAGTAEIIAHAKTGFLYNENNAESIENMTDFALQNPLMLQEVAQNAREYAKNRFTVEQYGHQLYEVIKKIILK